MGEHAGELGVDIFPGTPGATLVYESDGSVSGVVTGSFGVSKAGKMK